MRPARLAAGAGLLAALAVLSSGALTGQEKDKKAIKGGLPAWWGSQTRPWVTGSA